MAAKEKANKNPHCPLGSKARKTRDIPVQRVVLHAKVVPGEVARRVAQVVVLVPEDALAARRSRDDFHANRQLDGRDARLVLLSLKMFAMRMLKAKLCVALLHNTRFFRS